MNKMIDIAMMTCVGIGLSVTAISLVLDQNKNLKVFGIFGLLTAVTTVSCFACIKH